MSGDMAILRCPICGAALHAEERVYRCAAGHSYDRAREGYVNLARSKHSGDSKEMLEARRAFLDAGHYEPLAQAVGDAAAQLSRSSFGDAGPAMLDAGCGDGYYLSRVMSSTLRIEQDERARCVALDISKDAVRMAARRCTGATCVVADLQGALPIAGESLHLVLNIFAPRPLQEFTRILKPHGYLLSVIPAPDHLLELRESLGLLAIEDLKEERLLQLISPGFALRMRREVALSLQLDAQALTNLLYMTPNYRHPERLAGVRELAAITPVRASFVILGCERMPAGS